MPDSTPPEDAASRPPAAHVAQLLAALDGWRAALIVGAVHALAALVAFDPTPQVGGDNGAYRALGQSLATGQGYLRLWEPGHPAETIYPPAFPFLLSLPIRLGLDSWRALNAFMVPLSVGLAIVAYLWLRRLLAAPYALAGGLVIALSPGLLDLSHSVLSDLPFALLTALALWALHALDDERAPVGAAYLPAVAAGATILAYLTRSAGLPLAIVALAWLAWRRRYLAAGAIAGVLIPFALLWGRRAEGTARQGYADLILYLDPYQPSLGRMNAGLWVERIVENLQHYASTHLPALLFGSDYGPLVLASWVVLALALAGYLMNLRRPSPSSLWLPLYLGLLIIWPSTWSSERFLLPAYPLLVAYALATIPLLRRRIPENALLAAGAVVVAGLLYGDIERGMRGRECRAAAAAGAPFGCLPPGWPEYMSEGQRLRGRLPAGSVILARKPTLTYAQSGYASATYPFSTAPDTLFAEARRTGARYLVLDQFEFAARFVDPVVMEQPHRFCVLPAFQRVGAVVLRIDTTRTPAAGGARGDSTTGRTRLKVCALLPGER